MTGTTVVFQHAVMMTVRHLNHDLQGVITDLSIDRHGSKWALVEYRTEGGEIRSRYFDEIELKPAGACEPCVGTTMEDPETVRPVDEPIDEATREVPSATTLGAKL